MFHSAVMGLSCGYMPLVKQVPSLLEAFSTSPTPPRKPLALKLGSEKHRKAALWNSCAPALPQASSNQSSCSDQTTVNRQKPTIPILSPFCIHFAAVTKIR
ncbi:putative nicotinate-nucleotide-dimethylbenzimidazole phosphoribosyltransferase [Trichinella spiralis]|uniref:putative nicotinate-nucleotide-dimethylbenzimidazole phosphoribosyltransferase n=1 Tax=Trichinella spiralis TaxID=6334 RepID=UPI0001EFB695|nr:putative nicotinate-nucleotide-dimethylbenzimidazole phosphoribosyltransferase [Trichinella spiralis]